MSARPPKPIVARSLLRGVEAVEADTRQSFPRHMHETFGIGLIRRGAQRSASGRGPVEAGAGDVITVNPGEIHDGLPIGDAGRAWHMLYIDPDLLREACRDVSEEKHGEAEFSDPVIRNKIIASDFARVYAAITSRHSAAEATGSLFSPAGRRWPEGPDEGGFPQTRSMPLHPPLSAPLTSPPQGGRRGVRGGPQPISPLAGEMPDRAEGGGSHKLQVPDHSRSAGSQPAIMAAEAWLLETCATLLLSQPTTTKPCIPASIRHARTLIDDDPTAPISLSDLAGASGLSRYQVLRAFTQSTGLTPHAYIIQRRLNMARRLIITGMPLAEAAATSGFADQSHMTRLFTRFFGFSPGRLAAAL